MADLYAKKTVLYSTKWLKVWQSISRNIFLQAAYCLRIVYDSKTKDSNLVMSVLHTTYLLYFYPLIKRICKRSADVIMIIIVFRSRQ